MTSAGYEGGGGVHKISEKKRQRREGVHANSDITTQKNVQIFVFHLILVSGQQLSFVYHLGGSVISSIGLSPRQQAR